MTRNDLLEYEARPSALHVQKLVDEVRALKRILKSIEWAGDFCDEAACPLCLARHFKKHDVTCLLGKAIN